MDILKSKEHLVGVLISKQTVQYGQKPSCRCFMDVAGIGCKFIVYGGTAASVFNDIRCVDSNEYEWKVLKEDF